jgi:DNA-directed RNA polymerase I, II, and III subunit RPABC5
MLAVRCSCTKVLGNKEERFKQLVTRYITEDHLSDNWAKERALDTLGLKRICCRTAVLSHINLIDKAILQHAIEQEELLNRPRPTPESLNVTEMSDDDENNECED